MANRLYNKQVSPKGYQKGGSVKQSPMGSSSTKGNILRGKLKSQKELKKITGSKKYKDASYGEKTKMLNVATMAMGGRIRKMGGGMMMQRPMMEKGGRTKKMTEAQKQAAKKTGKKVMKVAKTIGKIVIPAAGAADVGAKLAKRLGRKMGGSLKPVNPQTQKGLSKLPTEVRNKMGYMKKGGKVHGK